MPQHTTKFGGQWTKDKLDILERYLDAYTTALKDRPFRLWYIDAFAGTGQIELSTEDNSDFQEFVSGSAQRAINIDDRAFDRLIFVEQRPNQFAELEKLKKMHADRDIVLENSDANSFLANLDDDWRGRRGVLFLDPFATQVEWVTLQKVASLQALDTWILFPVSALSRILPKSQRPDDIDSKWVSRLTTVFGGEDWRELYGKRRQLSLFSDDAQNREPGIDGILAIYKAKLGILFGDRFLQKTRALKNSKNSALFDLMFCAGSPNPRATAIAKRIAEHVLLKDL